MWGPVLAAPASRDHEQLPPSLGGNVHSDSAVCLISIEVCEAASSLFRRRTRPKITDEDKPNISFLISCLDLHSRSEWHHPRGSFLELK